MKKYYVTIEEMISETFEIEAEEMGEAMEMAKQGYKNGKYVLMPGNLVAKQMSAESEDSECCEWTEF